MVLPAILKLKKPGQRERAYNMKYKTHTYTREGTMKNLRRRDLP